MHKYFKISHKLQVFNATSLFDLKLNGKKDERAHAYF